MSDEREPNPGRTRTRRGENDRKYRIPAERQAEVLRLHYTGHSDRQVFLALYPAGGPPGSPKVGTFAEALHDLVRATEESLRRLAIRERVPFVSPCNPPGDAESAEMEADALELSEPVPEEPLAPGDEEALADLDLGRAALTEQLRILTETPTPDPPPPESFRWVDPAGERAKAVAMVSSALTANVAVRLRGASTRIARTVTLHNLRIARKEAQEAEREGVQAGTPDPSRPDSYGRPAPARGLVPAGVGEKGTPGAATSGFFLDIPAKA